MKQEVHGNLTGIRDSVIDALASLYNYEVEDGDFLPRELMQFLARFTGALNREIAVYITRDGEVVDYTGEGLLARAFCHELDHLDGILYTQQMDRLLTEEELEALYQ